MSQESDWVVESNFGKWFINSNTWVERVIQVALKDLVQHMDSSDD